MAGMSLWRQCKGGRPRPRQQQQQQGLSLRADPCMQASRGAPRSMAVACMSWCLYTLGPWMGPNAVKGTAARGAVLLAGCDCGC